MLPGMPTVLRVQCNLPRDTAIPADVVMNTWHFRTLGATTPTEGADAAVTGVGVFYAAIDSLLASYVGTPMEFKVYDLQDDEPRVPILDTTLSLSTGSGPAYPAEVAVCLSYRGSLASGTNPARRRGRIFIGPLDDSNGELGAGDTIVTSSTRGTIANAAEDLAGVGGGGEVAWVVFSPTLAGSPPWSGATLVDSSVDVVAGYVDNAFDIIRSRGSLPTLRSTWEVVLP